MEPTSEMGRLMDMLDAWVVAHGDAVEIAGFGPSWGGWLFVVKRSTAGNEPRTFAVSVDRLRQAIRDQFPDLAVGVFNIPADADLRRWLDLEKSIRFGRSAPFPDVRRN